MCGKWRLKCVIVESDKEWLEKKFEHDRNFYFIKQHMDKNGDQITEYCHSEKGS